MFPILFHFGSLVIPSYGAVTALGLLLALFLTQRTARICALNPNHLWNLSILATLLFLSLGWARIHLVKPKICHPERSAAESKDLRLFFVR